MVHGHVVEHISLHDWSDGSQSFTCKDNGHNANCPVPKNFTYENHGHNAWHMQLTRHVDADVSEVKHTLYTCFLPRMYMLFLLTPETQLFVSLLFSSNLIIYGTPLRVPKQPRLCDIKSRHIWCVIRKNVIVPIFNIWHIDKKFNSQYMYTHITSIFIIQIALNQVSEICEDLRFEMHARPHIVMC